MGDVEDRAEQCKRCRRRRESRRRRDPMGVAAQILEVRQVDFSKLPVRREGKEYDQRRGQRQNVKDGHHAMQRLPECAPQERAELFPLGSQCLRHDHLSAPSIPSSQSSFSTLSHALLSRDLNARK